MVVPMATDSSSLIARSSLQTTLKGWNEPLAVQDWYLWTDQTAHINHWLDLDIEQREVNTVVTTSANGGGLGVTSLLLACYQRMHGSAMMMSYGDNDLEPQQLWDALASPPALLCIDDVPTYDNCELPYWSDFLFQALDMAYEQKMFLLIGCKAQSANESTWPQPRWCYSNDINTRLQAAHLLYLSSLDFQQRQQLIELWARTEQRPVDKSWAKHLVQSPHGNTRELRQAWDKLKEIGDHIQYRPAAKRLDTHY